MTNCSQCQHENPPVAKFCMNCGTDLGLLGAADHQRRLSDLQQAAPPGLQTKLRKSRLSGQRKPVTILFTDIVGSTAIAETMDPEDWRDIVSGVHQRIGKAIYAYEGTITQLLGDGVYAFFGAPITHEDDPVRAVLSAMDIQQSIRDYASSLKKDPAWLQVRVGINTGEVVIGDIAADMHVEYLAFGDAVNVAARLESAAEPGAIVVSDATHEQVRHRFEVEDLEPIRAKGKKEHLAAFRIQKLRSEPLRVRGIEGLESPLVGRNVERESIELAIARLREGQGGILTLVGEAGLGKSRLVTEIRKSCFTDEVHWLEGRCLSYGKKTPYQLWTSALRDLFDLDATEPPSQQIERIEATITGRCPDQVDSILPYLLALLGLPEDTHPNIKLANLSGEALQMAIFNAIEILISGTAQQRPIVLVCEDLHWADPTSLELLERIVRLPETLPLMVILVLRPDQACGAWKLREELKSSESERFVDLELAPLSENQSVDLVQQLLASDSLPEELKHQILTRAAGNPFYVEEILRGLIDSNFIRLDPSSGVWTVDEAITDIPIADSLHAVLMARVDQLPEAARRTLDVAAVLGRRFDLDLLQKVLDYPADGILKNTALLIERQFFHPSKSDSPRTVVFKHALTQEVTYSALLKRDRKQMHAQVGAALEDLFPTRLDAWVDQLALHYLRAEVWDRAWKYNIAAGKKAQEGFANVEAIGYLLASLAMVDQLDSIEEAEVISTMLELAAVHDRINQYEEALNCLTEAMATAEKIEVEHQRLVMSARIHQKQGQVLRSMGEYERAEATIRAGLELVKEESSWERGALLIHLASILTRQGEYAEAKQACADGIADLEDVGDQVELAHAYSLLGTIQRDLGDTDASFTHRQKSLEISETIENLPLQMEAHNNLAVAYYDLGQYEKAVHHYQRSREISERIGNLNTLARAEINLGEIQIIWGEWDEAERAIQKALDIWLRRGYSLGQAYGSCVMGNLYVHREEPEDALSYLNRSLELFKELGAQSFLPAIYRLMADAYFLQGDLEQTEVYCQKALALAEELEMSQDQAVILRLAGRLWMESGDMALAQEKLEKSVTILGDMNVPYEHALSLCERARLRKHQGQDKLADQDLNQAISIFESLQAKMALKTAQDLLSS
jgi:predicted ATPase/class 3 adenylate cyclase